jgi:hypothetical protein
MPIELIELLGKHGLVGLAAAVVLYLAGKAFERGFSVTVNAPQSKNEEGTRVIVLRPDEPTKLPEPRRGKGRRARRRRRRKRSPR